MKGEKREKERGGGGEGETIVTSSEERWRELRLERQDICFPRLKGRDWERAGLVS